MLLLLLINDDAPIVLLVLFVVVATHTLAAKIRIKVLAGVLILLIAISLAFAETDKPIWTQINEHWSLIAASGAVVVFLIQLKFQVNNHEKQLAGVEAMRSDITELKTDMKWLKNHIGEK